MERCVGQIWLLPAATRLGAAGRAGLAPKSRPCSLCRYDQEVQLETIFLGLSQGFRKLDKLTDGGKQQALLKDLTAQMQEAKT